MAARSTALPLPVAALARRGRNAKSAKERHDICYFAWEASVRLGVAAHMPDDPTSLERPSVGQWVDALSLADRDLSAPELLAAFSLFNEVGQGRKRSPQSVSARALVGALAAYRNAAVGHGAVRPTEYYGPAADALLAGVEALWDSASIWPERARLVFVESIEIDPKGSRRGRVFDLTGMGAVLIDPRGVELSTDVAPQRLYMKRSDAYTSLHPWLLYQTAELRERVLFFNGRTRAAGKYLDYVSGEELRGRHLTEAFPGIGAVLEEAFSGAPEPPSEDDGEPSSDNINFGDFEVLGKLGEGGMGVVYLARQRTLDRLVALKTLPAHLIDDPVAVGRFEREIQALARCEHPNVVKVYGAGVDRDRHYYAMELIEGADLAEVAKALATSDDFARALSTAAERVRRTRDRASDAATPSNETTKAIDLGRGRDRVRTLATLFRDAARGVAHLHDHGVLHRDLKPGNLMVTEAETRLVVMDLGLAAVTDASQTLTKDRTTVLGTLRYMSPEQLQRNLLQLDRRADIYSLGATFYELLTGRAIFDGDSEARLIEQILREEPVPVRVANARVPDDLARIVHKAIRKDARERYDSAGALADDVEAYLAGKPIRARPPSFGYLLRKSLARNRSVVVGSAAAVVGLVVALAGGVSFQEYQRTSRCRDRDRHLGDVWNPDRRSDLEQALLAVDVPYAADTWSRISTELDAYTDGLLDVQVEACVSEGASLPPELRTAQALCLSHRKQALSALLDVLSEVDTEMMPRALPAAMTLPRLDRCSRPDYLAAEVKPPEDPVLEARIEELREEFEHVRALDETGRYEQAHKAGTELLEQAEAADFAPFHAEVMVQLGRIERELGAFEDAHRTLEAGYFLAGPVDDYVASLAAVELVILLGRDLAKPEPSRSWTQHAEVAIGRWGSPVEPSAALLNNRGAVLRFEGNYPGATELHRRALALQEGTLGPDHLQVAVSHLNLGSALQGLGNLEEALQHTKTALAAFENGLGAEHPDVVPLLQNLGIIYWGMGKYDEAVEIEQRAVELGEATLGSEHPEVAAAHTNLASALFSQARYEETLVHLQRALAIEEKVFGPDHPELGTSLANVGNILQSLARYDEALRYIRRAISLQERTQGLDHPQLGWSLTYLGSTLSLSGRYDLGLEQFVRALGVFERALGPGHVRVAATLLNIGIARQGLGDYAEAIELYERALVIQERAVGTDHPDVAATLMNLGKVHYEQENYTEALRYQERGLALRMAALGPVHTDTAMSELEIGLVLHEQRRYDEAVERFTHTLATWTAQLGGEHPRVADAHVGLCRAYLAKGETAKAVASGRRAVELRLSGKGDPRLLAVARFELARAIWANGQDRASATSLAKLALSGFRETKEDGRASKVEKWLARHRAAR